MRVQSLELSENAQHDDTNKNKNINFNYFIMKKIYSLILLGGLLFFGVQNAWATDPEYYVTHNDKLPAGANAWALGQDGDKMTKVDGQDKWYLQVNSVGTSTVEFKIDTNRDWSGVVGYSSDRVAGSEISLSSGGDGNISFQLSLTSSIIIYYEPTADKVYVEYAMCDVTVNLVGPASKIYTYSYSADPKFEHMGAWPGSDANSGTGAENDPYVYNVTLRHGYPLNIIFNNGSGTQSLTFEEGAITEDKTYTYRLDENYKITALVGEFNGWHYNNQFVNGEVTVSLAANTNYLFKVVSSNTWEGATGFITYSVSDYVLSSGGDNCTIHTASAGDYVFTFDASTHKMTVTYPDCKAIGFEKPAGWDKVYLYAWKGTGGSEVKFFGDFPGWELKAPYQMAFPEDADPEQIIWSDGTDSKKTADLNFVDKAIYNASGRISYAVTPTNADNGHYATFFAPYDTKLPSGVTASKGVLEGNMLNLSDFNSDVIPANTPVVLTASASGEFTIHATLETPGTAASESNSLSGKATETLISNMSAEIGTGTLMVLGVSAANRAGFYALQNAVTTVRANRAYLIIPGGTSAPSAIRIVDEENNATNIEELEASETAVKFIENGKLLIKKNGIVYDMTGRMVK